MKTLSVKLPDPLDAKLAALAKKKRKDKATVVRDALNQYVKQNQPESVNNGAPPVKGSFLELARKYIGKCEGPGDLSYNKAHLREYGK